MVDADGDSFPFGADDSYVYDGSLASQGIVLASPVVGIASNLPIGTSGYWLVGADG